MLSFVISLLLGLLTVVICWSPFYIFEIEKFPRYFFILMCIMPALAVTGGPYIAALFLKKDFPITSKLSPVAYSLMGGIFSMTTILLIYLNPVLHQVGIAKFLFASLHRPIKFISLVITSDTLFSRSVILFIAGFFVVFMTIKTHTVKQVQEIRRIQKLEEEWKNDLINDDKSIFNKGINRLLSKR